jgi:hypothetical protein
MTHLGHFDQFPQTNLSVGYRIGQRTFAAPSPIGCRAPKAAACELDPDVNVKAH